MTAINDKGLVIYKDIQSMFLSDSISKQVEMALPGAITPVELIRVSLTVIRTTPKLIECSQESLLACLFASAQLGLSPDPFLGHVYWVPFWSSKLRTNEAQLIPGYRGYVELGRRSGQITTVKADVVYERDFFELETGLEDRLVHRPFFGDMEKRGKKIGAWTVWNHTNGEKSWTFMTAGEIEEIRQKTKSRDRSGKIVGPWADESETVQAEMWKKTVIRRHAKLAPLSVHDRVRRDSIGRMAKLEGLALDYEPATQRLEVADTQEQITSGDGSPIKSDPDRGKSERSFDDVFSDFIDDEQFQRYLEARFANQEVSEIEFQKMVVEDEKNFRDHFERYKAINGTKKRSDGRGSTNGKKAGTGQAKKKVENSASEGAESDNGNTADVASSAGGKSQEMVDKEVFNELLSLQRNYPGIFKKYAKGKNTSDPKVANRLIDQIIAEVDGEGPPA